MTASTKPNPSAQRKFKSDAMEAIHASATALLAVGAIEKATMRQLEDMCFTSVPSLDASRIKKIRELQHVSQPIFARYLNTSESTVQKWESGAKQPSGMALKLLAVVEKHGLQVLA